MNVAIEKFEYAGRLFSVTRACLTFPPGKPFGLRQVARIVSLSHETTRGLLQAHVLHNFVIKEVQHGKVKKYMRRAS